MNAAYKNYIEVRGAVLKMIENCPADERPSKYWREEIAGFDYMFDASPLIINKLRHHSYHLTGLHDYEYRRHHARNAKKIEERLKLLKAQDKNNLLVPESPEMGGFGFNIGGALYNADTLKFYESLIALDKAGLLDQFRKTKDSQLKTVLEIGSGWGGLAYQFKTLFPKVAYAMVDFPETLLFSATYLKTLFPLSKIFISDGGKNKIENLKLEEDDFAFIPHYAWGWLNFKAPDLILNQASFQEMTTAQVDRYIKKAADWGVPHIYSWNRDHSPNNAELTTVSSVMKKYYKVEEIGVMPEKGIFGKIKNVISKKPQLDRAYRHLIGKI